MKASSVLSFGIASAVALGQDFEPPGFNVTEALIEIGVNVSAIPELAGLVQRSSLNACSIACNSLRLVFGSKNVLFPGNSEYEAISTNHWALQQADVNPYCIFTPSKTLEVSTLVLLSRLTQCPFAVKSGGHVPFAGASNIEGGITVSLQKMKEITVSSDNIASVGPGNVWYDVYTNLAEHDLGVMGGRVANIGVGGLTLGGGISHFTNARGWACDNVASYEVVTASGLVVTASATHLPDLYWALRGGGNNFGIVTRFDLETFSLPAGRMWGGMRTSLESEIPKVIDAFYNLGMKSAEDTDATHFIAFARAPGVPNVVSVELEYAKPVTTIPAILKEYTSIPAIQDTTGISTLAELTIPLNTSSPHGYRQTIWTATYRLDKDIVDFVRRVFFEEIEALPDIKNLLSITFQVISKPALAQMKKRGGNPLGLSETDGPLILLNTDFVWTSSADDTKVMQANSNLIRRTTEEAKRRGLASDFLYMNYGSPYQAVVPSYGAANQRKLKSISKKYDPTGVFQRLQPGFFKLDGAPYGTFP